MQLHCWLLLGVIACSLAVGCCCWSLTDGSNLALCWTSTTLPSTPPQQQCHQHHLNNNAINTTSTTLPSTPPQQHYPCIHCIGHVVPPTTLPIWHLGGCWLLLGAPGWWLLGVGGGWRVLLDRCVISDNFRLTTNAIQVTNRCSCQVSCGWWGSCSPSTVELL